MDTNPTPFQALQEAIHSAGGQSAMARLCGLAQPSVWKWLQSGKRLPAEHVLKVEMATGVSRHLLRPDIYPLSPTAEATEPGEECGPILTDGGAPVACDRRRKLQPDNDA